MQNLCCPECQPDGPSDFLSELYAADDNRPVHIYFMKKDPNMFNTTDVNNKRANLPKRILYAQSWAQLAEIFKFKPETICVNACHFQDASIFEITNMLDTFSKLVGMEKQVTITIGVHKDTPFKLIKEAQKSRILGLVPATEDWGIDECVKGIQAHWANIPYWPKHIMDEIAGSTKTSPISSEIKLTHRQQQIFDIIVKSAASNKHIARMLGIAESTVKLHLSHIFKKYGVRTRTQLVAFTKSSKEV